MAGKEYRLEDDLLKKSRPKWKSERYKRLQDALWNSNRSNFARCEFCKKVLLNPQSILIHQGGFCQKNKT